MNQIVHHLKPNIKKNLAIILKKNGDQQEILAAFIGTGKQRFQLTTLQDHKALHSQSFCQVRGVLFDQSQATIKGLIKIAKKAQHTNAFLEEKILLVGPKARAKAEPMLEIEANEVKASHAATVGKLDQEQMFYLQTRGLSHKIAQKVLVLGFISPVLEKINNQKLKNKITKSINNQLSTKKL